MMKKLLNVILFLFVGLNTFAQTSTDILVKTNGEEMKGKVIKVTDTDVTFVYSGKTAEYVVKKSEVLKIVHSSGRTETSVLHQIH